jgi:hypothetical protein
MHSLLPHHSQGAQEDWMRRGKEGKLLARAAGFITLGERTKLARFVHSHQGEREKNEYS